MRILKVVVCDAVEIMNFVPLSDTNGSDIILKTE